MFTVKEEKKYIGLDEYEEGAVIKALNDMRTKQIAEGKPVDVENELILRIIRTPMRKARANGNTTMFRRGSVREGGAAGQAGFYRDIGDIGKRSPRQRDEAR